MSQETRWAITFGLIFALIQSLLWIGFASVAAFTYLCVIPVAPYKNENDFFRVTLVKLYFEGPQCIPDGSYLGKFNEEYRKILNLFTPDRVFAIMIAYVILNTLYFLLSIRLYINRNNKRKRLLSLAWSGMTLLLCIVDVIFTYEIVLDVFTLKSHMSTDPELSEVVISSATKTLGEIPYISLVLALVTIRFIAIWMWNLFIGFFIFLDTLCFAKTTEKPSQSEEKREKLKKNTEEEPRKLREGSSTSVNFLNGKHDSTFDVKTKPEYLEFEKSMEAITRFSSVPDNASSYGEKTNRNWEYAPNEGYWHPSKSYSNKGWEMTNEGFINDEPISFEPEKRFDFDHDLKNFESGARKIKIVKPPIGKPVEPVTK